MDDGADVGFVDAHAEGDGGDDYFQFSGEEVALDAFACAGIETGVIGGSASAEGGGEFFCRFAGWSIDDGGAIGFFFEEIYSELVAARFGEFDDLDGEVVATEAMDEELGFCELELRDDVFLNCWRGSCSEGDDWRGTESREEVSEGAVVRTKVVAPGGDAVGLVDGDERGFFAREHLGEVGDAHALGCDEEKLESPVEVVAAGLTGVVAGEARVNAGDAEACGGELCRLVVHERDERRDDKGGSPASDGGELVTERFSCSGGHDEEDVATVCGGTADSLLICTKGRKAEGCVEQGG